MVEHGAEVLLGFVVIPVWIVAGLADYFCHRATDIEHTSGAPESILHLLQLGLIGIPLLAAMVLQINGAVLLGLVAFAIAHHIVAYVDVRYANQKRVVTPLEQMVHSFLELLPISALLLVFVIHFDQVEALLGLGKIAPEYALRMKVHPLPLWYIGAVVAGAIGLNLGPYTGELLRALRQKSDSRPQERKSP